MLDTPNHSRIAVRREAVRAEILAAAWEVARESGLAQMSLRDVADRVGMRAPSLYTHFESKNAIYDAMFGQAWQGYLDLLLTVELPTPARAALRVGAHHFFDFAVADLTRFQLMNQRIIPGWEPSAAAYAPSLATREHLDRTLRERGLGPEDADLYVALIGGLADSQLANDPGGDRWGRLLDRAVDMLADDLDLPPDDADLATATDPGTPTSLRTTTEEKP